MFDIVNMTQELFNMDWHTYSDHLKEMMKNLMVSKETADVTLICEDKTKFKAHKFLLEASSPVFKDMISDLPQKENSVIYLRGVLSKEMEAILKFVYIGQATFYHDRINEFLNVAKTLEIKALNSKNVHDANAGNEKTNISEGKECTSNDGNIDPSENTSDEKEIVDLSGIKNENDCDVDVQEPTDDLRDETGKYACPKCNKTFTQKGACNRHYRSVHEGIRIPCNICGKTFTEKSHVERHILMIHESSLLPCNLCNHKAINLSKLNIHKRKTHLKEVSEMLFE